MTYRPARPDRHALARIVAVTGALLMAVGPARAEEASTPKPVIGDERAVPTHMDQADIEAGRVDIETLRAHGKALFDARFTTLDGAGRPEATAAIVPTRRPPGEVPTFFRTSGPDANACAGCHNQPESGGAGDFVANVFVSPQENEFDFDTIQPELSMERGSTALHGSGLMELLAREITADLQAQQRRASAEARATGQDVTVALTSKGIDFGTLTAKPDGWLDVGGLDGIDADLVVKPFSQKAVFVSLRHFTLTAMNNHHGMQGAERFNTRWTGFGDFDGDGHPDELTDGDITAVTLFQALLAPPMQVLPADPTLRAAAERGRELFEQVGCAACHRPALVLDDPRFIEPNPYNVAGSLRPGETATPVAIDLSAMPWADRLERTEEGKLIVPIFTDFKRHRIADADAPYFANEVMTQGFVPRDKFRTAPLWGVGSTAPYGHRGDVTTMTEAILHHGGEATEARRAFEALSETDRASVVEFLKSLLIVPEKEPPADPPTLVRSDEWRVVQ